MTTFRSLAAAVLLSLCLPEGAGTGPPAETPSPAATWRPARAGHTWAFPEDHWAHHAFRTEWWHLTGHLECGTGERRRFGYQFTVFRIGLLNRTPDLASDWAADTLIMGHAAITDLASGEHRFADLLHRVVPLLGGFGRYPDPLIAWARAPAGTAGTWSLRFNGEAFDFAMQDDARRFGFDLSTRPLKPLVMHGPNGLSRKGGDDDAASLYYSLTRLQTTGRVHLEGAACRVSGIGWMDREFGSHQLGEAQVGWDWFSLQLDDGRDLMLYLLRRADGRVDFRNGTLVDPGGAARYLNDAEWSVRVTETWRSPRTGARYPARWLIDLPGEDLRVEVLPRAPDQENRGSVPTAPFYWEGAVSVRGPGGAEVGRGYVELTGYGEDNRPPI